MNDKQGVPHSGKYVAYYRVSTKKQGASGLGLEAQREIVQQHLNGGDWEIIGEFTEMESGKRADRYRPELKKARDLCDKTGATLVVATMDRLTRDVHFLTTMIKNRSKFVIADMPGFGNPADTRWQLTSLANNAEYEAAKISQRTKAALKAAKARGTVLGSPTPEIGSKLGTKRVIENADAYAAEVMVVIAELQKYGCDTLQKIANGLEARGIETVRGGTKWYPSSVRNVMNRSRDQ